MDDFLNEFFSSKTSDELETEAPEITEIEEVAHDPDEADVEQTPAEIETETEAEPAPTAEPKMVSLSAVHAERQLKKEAYEQVKALNIRLAEYEQKQNQTQAPDPYDDPQAYTAYNQQSIAQQVQEAIQIQRFKDSQDRAITQYGQEFVTEVSNWAADLNTLDPSFGAKVFAQPDPAAWVISEKKRSDLLKEFEADPDAFALRRAAELGLATVAPAAEATSPARMPNGPKSLATAKSRDTANNLPTTPEDAFDAIFK